MFLKWIQKLLVIILTLAPMLAIASAPKVHRSRDDVYTQYFPESRLRYSVDTVTRLCFIGNDAKLGGSLTPIDCADLAKRREWKSIITWVKDE